MAFELELAVAVDGIVVEGGPRGPEIAVAQIERQDPVQRYLQTGTGLIGKNRVVVGLVQVHRLPVRVEVPNVSS